MHRVFKYGDTENNYLTPDKQLNTFIYDILNGFLRHHMQELRTFKNGPVLLAHLVNARIRGWSRLRLEGNLVVCFCMRYSLRVAF